MEKLLQLKIKNKKGKKKHYQNRKWCRVNRNGEIQTEVIKEV